MLMLQSTEQRICKWLNATNSFDPLLSESEHYNFLSAKPVLTRVLMETNGHVSVHVGKLLERHKS